MARQYIRNCTGDSCEKEGAADRIASKTAFFVLLAAFVGVSAYVLLFSPYLQISKIDVSGTQELSDRDLRQTLQAYLDGKFFGVVPRNNLLLVPRKKIAGLLTDDFKKIRSAGVTKVFPGTISIEIDERKSLLVWCAGEGCFLIDENGIAYGAADFNSPEIVQNHLIKITDLSARAVEIGDKVIEPAYERYALGIKDALASVGQEADGDAYVTPSAMADEIDVKTVQGMRIYFSTQFPLESAVQMLATVWEKEIPADKRASVDYVDLRSEGRVFYKFK